MTTYNVNVLVIKPFSSSPLHFQHKNYVRKLFLNSKSKHSPSTLVGYFPFAPERTYCKVKNNYCLCIITCTDIKFIYKRSSLPLFLPLYP